MNSSILYWVGFMKTLIFARIASETIDYIVTFMIYQTRYSFSRTIDAAKTSLLMRKKDGYQKTLAPLFILRSSYKAPILRFVL